MATVETIHGMGTSSNLPEASAADIDAALAYEQTFVPALFAEWSAHVIAAADVRPGHRTLDIACGTGALTRELPGVVGARPAPVGLDIAPGMLAVAKRLNPEIDWRWGNADSLPFMDASFDRVLCQYGLMFFPDRENALREMCRVLAPAGRVAFAVWDSLENNPGFQEKVNVLDRVSGRRAGDALRAPFCLGDRESLKQMAEYAGLANVELKTIDGSARFASLYEFVEVEIRGWLPIMGVHLPEEEIRAIHTECQRRLSVFEVTPGGEISLPTRAHVVSGTGGRDALRVR